MIRLMKRVVLDGHEESERMCCTTASSFPLEITEVVHANLDTGATVDIFLVNFARGGVGDGSSYEKCKSRSLNERLTSAHRVLASTAPAHAPAPASETVGIAYKEQQNFYVGHDGGCMSLIHSKIVQETMRCSTHW